MEDVKDLDSIQFMKNIMLTEDELENARQVIADVLGIETGDVIFDCD